MNKTIWDYNTRLRKSTKYVRQGDIILEMKKIQKKKKYLLWFWKMIYFLAPQVVYWGEMYCSQGHVNVSSAVLSSGLMAPYKR